MRKNQNELMAFMDDGHHIRRMIYTTNPVEGLHRVLGKVTKSKGTLSNDLGLLKQPSLALKYKKNWKCKAFSLAAIQREFTDKYGERYENHV